MILDRILDSKRDEIERARQVTPLAEIRARALAAGPVRLFAAALEKAAAVGPAIIAEVKKGSPSKGIIRADFDPVAIACDYQSAGAAGLSVLTDREFFFGDLSYLQQIRDAVSLPLLRKDFIIDSYQVYESRAAGADAILLIAAALPEEKLEELTETAHELDLDVLFEVHDAEEMQLAHRLPVDLIGINNRNLRTFETDLAVTERLAPLAPPDRLLVAESGIADRDDIRRLQKSAVQTFLVGESLMRQQNVAARLGELLKD